MVIVAGGTPGFIGNFLSLIRPLALYSRVRAKMTCDRQAQAKTKEGDLLTGELRSHSIRKNFEVQWISNDTDCSFQAQNRNG
jgi:hypothetical protein